MPGLRLVLITGAIVAIVMIVRRLASSNKSAVVPPKEPDVDQVVPCGRCGVHVPEKELVERDGRRICHECNKA